MSEADTRKSAEVKNLKEKFEIHGVFGGEHGRDRKYQIQYIDKKLGFLDGQQKKDGAKSMNTSLSKNKIRTSYQNIENTEEKPTLPTLPNKIEEKVDSSPPTVKNNMQQDRNEAKFTDEEIRKFQKRYEQEER